MTCRSLVSDRAIPTTLCGISYEPAQSEGDSPEFLASLGWNINAVLTELRTIHFLQMILLVYF